MAWTRGFPLDAFQATAVVTMLTFSFSWRSTTLFEQKRLRL
jgi:hypothetical protein